MSYLLTSRNWTVPDSPNSETDVYAASGCINSWQSAISSLLNIEPIMAATSIPSTVVGATAAAACYRSAFTVEEKNQIKLKISLIIQNRKMKMD